MPSALLMRHDCSVVRSGEDSHARLLPVIATLRLCRSLLVDASDDIPHHIVARSLATCVVITNIRTAECETNKWILYKKIDWELLFIDPPTQSQRVLVIAALVCSMVGCCGLIVSSFIPHTKAEVKLRLARTLTCMDNKLNYLALICPILMFIGGANLWLTRDICAQSMLSFTSDVGMSGIGEGAIIILSHVFDDEAGQMLCFYFAGSFLTLYSPIFDLFYQPCGESCKASAILVFSGGVLYLFAQCGRLWESHKNTKRPYPAETYLTLAFALVTGVLGGIFVWRNENPARDNYNSAFPVVAVVIQALGIALRQHSFQLIVVAAAFPFAPQMMFPTFVLAHGESRAGMILVMVSLAATILAPVLQNGFVKKPSSAVIANQTTLLLLALAALGMFYESDFAVDVQKYYAAAQCGTAGIVALIALIGVTFHAPDLVDFMFYGCGVEVCFFAPSLTSLLQDALWNSTFAFCMMVAFMWVQLAFGNGAIDRRKQSELEDGRNDDDSLIVKQVQSEESTSLLH